MHDRKRPFNGALKSSQENIKEQEQEQVKNETCNEQGKPETCVILKQKSVKPQTKVNPQSQPPTLPVIQLTPASAASTPIATPIPANSNVETLNLKPSSSNITQNTDEKSSLGKDLPLAASSNGAPTNYCARRTWISTERMNELRRKAQESAKQNKIFTIRGCFHSVRNALLARGWVEKLDMHRKVIPNGQMTYEDLTQRLPKRKAGETRRQYVLKCEKNIMSRFLEHMPVDFLWTNRKEKCDYIDQAKNPGMTINKFHRAPFTSKEGLCSQLRDFHWFFEEGTAEMYFPRCYNVWSPEELGEFIDNFKLTASIAFLRALIDRFQQQDDGQETVFAVTGKVPYSAIDFACKRCVDYIDSCQHNDIDYEDPPKIWEHDWDAFLYQHQQFVNERICIQHDGQRNNLEPMINTVTALIEKMKLYWPQYSLDGYQNLWIIKPANKCRGRGIILMDNLKKILSVVNPSIASKSRYVVQKYIERPLILFQTKFDIRQWFLITNTQPLVVWMYRESYLRFSSQEYSLSNHHESVHLTNYAIQKKYTNGKRDKRLPSENMWDCYSFQAYLRTIGKQSMWLERIYPGMRKAIVGTMLASQENMDRRPNTFELFGADFMICENFYPWLIEINSSPDLGATTSVTARMCPQCLEDVVKVVIDRRTDPKADLGNFELAYRQVVPPTPAYMGLNLYVKGKQLLTKVNQHGNGNYYYHNARKERTLQTSSVFRQRSTIIPATISRIHKAMPTFNATDYMEKYMVEPLTSSRSSISASGSNREQLSPLNSMNSTRQKLNGNGMPTAPTSPCPYLLKQPNMLDGCRRSIAQLLSASVQRPIPTGSNGNDIMAPKRQRSCGPRLNSINKENIGTGVGERKFKFVIKNLSKPSTLPPTGKSSATATTSKSENNLLDLFDKTKKKPNDTQLHIPNTAAAAAATGVKEARVEKRVAPAPDLGDTRRWRSLRNSTAKLTVKSATTNTATINSATATFTAAVTARRFTRSKSELESMTNMHAIGRNFGRKMITRSLPTTAQPPTSVATQNMANTLAECQPLLTIAAQVISPRTASATSEPLNDGEIATT